LALPYDRKNMAMQLCEPAFRDQLLLNESDILLLNVAHITRSGCVQDVIVPFGEGASNDLSIK
jgi:hypothetical protein